MGRGGILFLGAICIFWIWLALRTTFPNNAIELTAYYAVPHACLAIKLFLECKCGPKKDSHKFEPPPGGYPFIKEAPKGASPD